MRAGLAFLGTMTAVAVAFPLSHAWAYLDPGTGSFILQTLLGGIAGVLVVGRLYWEKLKHVVWRAFNRNADGGETGQQ